MENNFDDIIESVLTNSAVWISGTYGTGKSHILNQLREFFIDKNYEVRSFNVESNETLVNFFNKITTPIININNNDQDFELHLSRLLETISESQKNGLVMLIDELEFWFSGMEHERRMFIQLLAEFAIQHKNVFLIIASSKDISIGENNNFRNGFKDRFHEIRLG
ncbi:hypothetical protein LCGC14_1245210 [marine sediment metagenome]|uniref:AAA+ ATPase domain-containing protein n=1 Tax=marine sediment metagenome TaxID=412755 RepID=A0A0F9L4R3_9ZZZZ